MTPLHKHLQESLTAKQYLTLNKYLNISDTKLSRLLSGTDKFNSKQIYLLSKLLNVMPYELIITQSVKNEITIEELEKITKKFEDELKKKTINTTV